MSERSCRTWRSIPRWLVMNSRSHKAYMEAMPCTLYATTKCRAKRMSKGAARSPGCHTVYRRKRVSQQCCTCPIVLTQSSHRPTARVFAGAPGVWVLYSTCWPAHRCLQVLHFLTKSSHETTHRSGSSSPLLHLHATGHASYLTIIRSLSPHGYAFPPSRIKLQPRDGWLDVIAQSTQPIRHNMYISLRIHR